MAQKTSLTTPATIIALLDNTTPETVGAKATKARQELGKAVNYGGASELCYETAISELGRYERAIRTGDDTAAQHALGQAEYFIIEAFAARRQSAH